MRPPHRNRCRSALLALCIGLIVLVSGAGAVTADYIIDENGTAYHAVIEVSGLSEFSFMEPGLLGEQIPLQITDVTLSNDTCSDCPYTIPRPSVISFPPGNYTIRYNGVIRDNHLQAMLDAPYEVHVTLPAGLDVRNPLLGVISRGGAAEVLQDGSIGIQWNETRFFEIRFYDPSRELLLMAFGTVWLSAIVMFTVPYLLTRRGKRRE